MKKSIIALLVTIISISLFAQNDEFTKKWKLGLSYTPNISYLYNPDNYNDYNNAYGLKDISKFEAINFGLRVSYRINEKSELETGIIYSYKSYSDKDFSDQIYSYDQSFTLYNKIETYFIDIPILYKNTIKIFQKGNLKVITGITGSISLYKYMSEGDLYSLYTGGYLPREIAFKNNNITDCKLAY